MGLFIVYRDYAYNCYATIIELRPVPNEKSEEHANISVAEIDIGSRIVRQQL